jgi:hypothetical protein
VTIVPMRETNKKKEKTYIKLIRCHCFGSNLSYKIFSLRFLILYPICVLVIFISYSYYYHSDDVVYYLLMLGGRSNTNLFSSPTQSARLPHTTISVEQSTTGGLDEERKNQRSLSINNEWVMVRTHCHIHTNMHRLFTAVRAIPVWCIWREETNECVTGPRDYT